MDVLHVRIPVQIVQLVLMATTNLMESLNAFLIALLDISWMKTQQLVLRLVILAFMVTKKVESVNLVTPSVNLAMEVTLIAAMLVALDLFSVALAVVFHLENLKDGNKIIAQMVGPSHKIVIKC